MLVRPVSYVRYSTLQYVTVCYSMLQYVILRIKCDGKTSHETN
jgi:hypothetical protein